MDQIENSSFVRRITSRVSEILPQPSSWLSKWLSPAAPSQVETRHESEDEADDELVYPNVKRPRLHSNNLHNQRPIPEDVNISPIVNSTRMDDRAIAGPSGLHIKKVNTSTSTEPQHFISSTPAVMLTTHHLPPPSTSVNVDSIKINGDDVSESGESTSGCSSLVPQGERVGSDYPFSTPRPMIADTPKLSTSSHSLNTSASRSFHSRSKYPKLDLSSSSTSRERPSFDSFVFNNPHVTSFRDDRSPFHRGRTMYGGAAGSRETLSETILSVSPHLADGAPQVISARPSTSSQPHHSRDVVGTSAMRILRALDQFSSPVLDAKRIPLRSPNERLKRKAPTLQPYSELSIPQMPDLLRIKRREAVMAARKGEGAPRVPSSSLSSAHPQPSSVGQVDNKETTKVASPIKPPPPKQSPPSQNKGGYSLREDDSKNTQRHIGSIKRKDKEDHETIARVNLPKVKLDVKTLPKFSIDVPSQSSATSKKTSTVTKKSPTKEGSHLSKTNPLTPSKVLSKQNVASVPKSEYKFSQPIIVSTAPSESVSSIKPTISFSLPIDPNTPSIRVHPSSQQLPVTKQPLLKKKVEPPKTQLLHDRSVMEILGGNKPSKPQEEERTCPKCANPITKDSVECVKCVNEKSSAKKSSLQESSFWSSLAKPTDKWSCKECYVSNNNKDEKCVACSTSRTTIPPSSPAPSLLPPKPDSFWSTLSKKDDRWSCKECFSENPLKEDKCLACTALKPTSTNASSEGSSAVTSTTPSEKSSSFWGLSKPSDKWSCKECFVPNSNEEDKCVACSSPRNPPTSIATTSTPVCTSTSNSGLPLLTMAKAKGWECSVCLVNNKPESDECVACTTPKPGSKPKAKPPTFNFGIPPSEEKPASSFSFGVPPSEDKPKSSTLLSYGTPVDPAKPVQFSFGIPQEEKKPEEKKDQTQGKTAAGGEKPSNSLGGTFKEPEKSDAASVSKVSPPVFTFGANKPIDSSSKPSNPPKLEGFENVKPESKVSETKPIGFGQPGGVQDSTFKSLFSSKSASFGQIETKSDTLSKSPITFGARSASETTFGSTEKKPLLFGAVEASKSSFGNSQSEKESSSLFSKETKPAEGFAKVVSESPSFSTPSSLFSAPKEQQPLFQPISAPEGSSLGGFQAKPLSNSTNPPQESKSNIFTFGSQSSSEKKVTNAFSVPAEKPAFFGNSVEKTAFGSQSGVFASNGVINSVTSGQSTFSFNNSTEGGGSKPPPSIFGTFNSDQPQQTTNSLFNFNKEDAPPDKKPTGGFNFNNSPAQPTFNFSTQPSPAPPQITPSVASSQPFGSFNATPFSSTPQVSFGFGQPSQSTQQSAAPIVFGQTQSAGSAPASNSVFTFSATQQKPTAATAPPTFDPNIKPNIKFTSGSIPTFSAMPMESGTEEPRRMIKKAIRRTKLNR